MITKTNSTLSLVILALIAVIFIQRCNCACDGVIPTVDSVTTTDTFWKKQDTFWRNKPVPYKIEVPVTVPPEYIPNPDCEELKTQYSTLVDKYLTRRIYIDTARYDSSFVVVTDTIEKNKIDHRRYDFHLKYPLVKQTTTITKIIPERRQVYFGGGVSGNNTQLINRFDVGLLYKDKKDRVFIVDGTADLNGNYGAEISSYWKISLRRK